MLSKAWRLVLAQVWNSYGRHFLLLCENLLLSSLSLKRFSPLKENNHLSHRIRKCHRQLLKMVKWRKVLNLLPRLILLLLILWIYIWLLLDLSPSMQLVEGLTQTNQTLYKWRHSPNIGKKNNNKKIFFFVCFLNSSELFPINLLKSFKI